MTALAYAPDPAVLTDGPRFAQFCAEHIAHTKGRQFAGKPLILEAFQREFFDELLSVDPATGHRYYSEAVWGLPRKNGKSTSVAAFGLYMASCDGEPGAEVYCAAAARQQARIIFDQDRRFVITSPTLSEEFVPRRNWIDHPATGSVLRVISSDAPKQHGLNPSANVIDELHAHESGDLYAALTSAGGAREQPLTLTITTAGWNKSTVLGEIVDKALARTVLVEKREGLTIVRDRVNGFLLWWHGAPDDADPDDPAVWRIANPAPWITDRYLARERHKPSMRLNDFRQLHLNQWPNIDEDWLPVGAWTACKSAVELDPALPVSVGIDIALTHDYAAVVVAQRRTREGLPDQTVVRTKFWSNPWEEGHPNHDKWELEIAEVREYLRTLHGTYKVAAATKPDSRVPAPGPAFVYDPWKFTESAQTLRSEGLNMIEFPQFNRYMVPASSTLYEQIVTTRIGHDGDTTLTEHIGNARGLRTDRGWRIRKPKDKNGREIESKHIDGAVAAAMAVHQAQYEPPRPMLIGPKRPSAVGF
jgi:phage terminase large subunit-like protein